MATTVFNVRGRDMVWRWVMSRRRWRRCNYRMGTPTESAGNMRTSSDCKRGCAIFFPARAADYLFAALHHIQWGRGGGELGDVERAVCVDWWVFSFVLDGGAGSRWRFGWGLWRCLAWLWKRGW